MSDQPERISPKEERAARLTAFVLGELSESERQQVQSEVNPRRREVCDDVARLATALLHSARAATFPEPSAELRATLESKLSQEMFPVELKKPVHEYGSRVRWLTAFSTGSLLLVVAVAISTWMTKDVSRSIAMKSEIAESEQQTALQTEASGSGKRDSLKEADPRYAKIKAKLRARVRNYEQQSGGQQPENSLAQAGSSVKPREVKDLRAEILLAQQNGDGEFVNVVPPAVQPNEYQHLASAATTDPAQIVVTSEAAGQSETTTLDALPTQSTPSYIAGVGISRGGRSFAVQGVPAPNQLAAGPTARGVGTLGYGYGRAAPSQIAAESLRQYRRAELEVAESQRRFDVSRATRLGRFAGYYATTAEQYSQIIENRFLRVADEPLSTFSIDVDTASYANARRFLTQNQMPPTDAIRIEEFINYFSYEYPLPSEGEAFSVNLEVAECPWQPAHQLVRIGLKGRDVPQEKRPACNVVFLLDVSGSMQPANKLPLLKQAMKLLTDQLTETDRVSIVTYAGNAGLALETTNGESKQTIRDAIDVLNANGSTNGSAGIQLAYEKATEAFIKDGANRVILATDGDLNVGVTDDDALVELIKTKAASGVFLTVLGFGEGNLKDGKLEKLADNGNGMYAYIDSLREARKVLVEQISGSLVTIAKDVKIKVEFNPAEVAAYRLLGYENRLMSAPDFDNDAKDAGEIGAGHTVTALYEIVPGKISEQLASAVRSLKYQRSVTPPEPPKELTAAAGSGELLTLFLRYKQPEANESTSVEFTVENKQRAFADASADFRFAAAVASFAMVLRNSEFRGESSFAMVEQIASSAIGSDPRGHRTELLDLVRKSTTLSQPSSVRPR